MLFRPVADERIIQCLVQGVLITRHKALPPNPSGTKNEVFTPPPALKICLTTGLSKKEGEKAVHACSFNPIFMATQPLRLAS